MTTTVAAPQHLAHLADRIRTSPMRDDPYRHTFVRDCLPEPVVADLIAAFPTPDAMTHVSERWSAKGYSDARVSIAVPDGTDARHGEVLAGLDPALVRVAGLLQDTGTVRAVLDRFLPTVRQGLGRLAHAYGKDGFTIGSSVEFVYDATGFQLPPHTDGTVKLAVGLLYLAQPGDPPDLGTRLYRPKDPGYRGDPARGHPWEAMDEVAIAPYERNTMFLFGRTNASYHGVVAADTDRPRRLVQFSIAGIPKAR